MMINTEATKFFLLFNLAIADKKIDPKEYEILNKYSKLFTDEIKREEIDFKNLMNLPKEEKSQFYAELVEMMCCDGDIAKEELILCGMIGEVMGADAKSCIKLARESLENESTLRTKIAQGFLSFVNEYDSNVNRPIAFINDFFHRDSVHDEINQIRILMFGSNEKVSLNEDQIIELFNKTFITLGLPGIFDSKNFKFYIESYSKVKKMSNDVVRSIGNNKYDYAILGSKPHMMVNGFAGSWGESETLTSKIGKKNIFENHQGYTKSFLKRTITRIGINIQNKYRISVNPI